MKFHVTFNKRNKFLGLFFIFIISLSHFESVKSALRKNNNINPIDIVGLNLVESDKRVEIDINEKEDPLEYMRRKSELINLYLGGTKKKESKPKDKSTFRFKQSPNKTNSFYVTKPTELSKIGEPTKKEIHNEEEIVNIKRVFSNDSYLDVNPSVKNRFDPSSILKDDQTFWCSGGNHEFNKIVSFYVEFQRSFRLSAFWIHWAFAPGQFNILYSNTKEDFESNKFYEIFGMRDSIKGGDTNWWKSVISDPKTRWMYKSFDERVNFDEPIWARYIRIDMRLPVNQYYGIYKLEFYMKSKAIVMIKTKRPGQNSCVSVINGRISEQSPVFMINCLQAIAYGDNRELFVLNSNGMITTYSENRCLQSPSLSQVNVSDCGKSSEFKDDREKWILEYDGKIRSMKEMFTCLSVTDYSVSNEIPAEDLKFTASSYQNDGIHGPENVVSNNIESYWASNPTNNKVIFEIFFHKYPYTVHSLSIRWKFPAKNFSVYGLYTDGYWKVFMKKTDNNASSTEINLKNKDFMGIRIIMTESSSRIEDKFVYGIVNISLTTGGRYLRRDPCADVLLDANKFEIIDVSILDKVTGFEFNKAMADFHQSRTKMKIVENLYQKIPDTIIVMKETSSNLSENIKSVKTEFLDMQLKIAKFEDFLASQNFNVFSLAASEHFPAHDCAHLIKAFPSKRSGFYWIKNECMDSAHKVYCDFDLYGKKGGLDYLIYNENLKVNTQLSRKFRNFNDIRYMCYQIGMEPLEIKNEVMLKNVYYLLRILDYDLNSESVIPIAYDYNCDTSKCPGIFKSFNSNNSGDISSMIEVFNDEFRNGISNLFTNLNSLNNSQRNTAALGKVGSIILDSLNTFKISAVICSTNRDGRKGTKNYINAKCSTNLRSEEFSSYQVFSSLRIKCPRGCSKFKKLNVYGTDIYTDNSSVCRAAVHAGVKKDDEESIVEVHFEPGKNKYLGVDRFNILSNDYTDKWDKSFSLRKYKPICPIDKLVNYMSEDQISSFIEFSSQENTRSKLQPILNERLKKLELIKEIQKVIGNYEYLVDQDPSFIANNKRKKLVENLGTISRFLQEDVTNKGEQNLGKADTGPSIINNDVNNIFRKSPIPLNSVLSYDQSESIKQQLRLEDTLRETQNKIMKQREAEQFEKFVDYEFPKIKQTTENAISYFSSNMLNEKTQINIIKKISDDFKGMVGKTTSIVEILKDDKDTGVNSQMNTINDLDSKTNEISKYVYEIDRKTNNKLKQTEFLVKEAKERMNHYNIHESFTEDYNNQNIFDQWSTYTSKKGKGAIPEWNYFQYHINGHFTVIQHKGGFIDNRTGTHLILKHRDYYDFEFKCSFMLKDALTFGIAFRYKDPYNYYVFQVTKRDGGLKRIRRFSKGTLKQIDIKNDGGFNPNSWYNVKIHAVQSHFKIYMTDYNGPDLDKHYELIFDFKDNLHLHGTIAFASNAVTYLLLDNISIVPVDCTNFDDGAKAIALTPTCSRFRETFRNGFNSRWKVIDPLDYLDGPSMWKTIEDFDDRDIILSQLSEVYGNSDSEEGSIYLLNDQTKICNKGRYILQFKALSQGIVGLIFRYERSEKSENTNFYILEISGMPNNKFVRIRKKIDNKFSLVSINSTLGYIKNSWTKIILTIENNAFNAFISDQDNLLQVFPKSVIDNDIKFGLIGISTYKTKILIDTITLSPFDNIQSLKNSENPNLLYVDMDNTAQSSMSESHDKSIFKRINNHISHFTWAKCLTYRDYDERLNYCNILFTSEPRRNGCRKNFCSSCCESMVDNTNKEHQYLCDKQCQVVESGSNKKSWNSCVEVENPESSVYPYCDRHFKKDYFEKQRCKVDMCNLCCVSYDNYHKPTLKNSSVTECYTKCSKVS